MQFRTFPSPRHAPGLFLIAAALPLACAVAPGERTTTSSSQAALSTNAVVTTTLVDHLSGKCLDVEGANYTNGTPIDEYDCNGTGAQEWIINTTNGTILNAVSGMCLDLTGWGTADGTKIELWDCQSNLQGNQQWRLQSDGSIVNTWSNKCLNIWGGNPADGALVQLYECYGTSNEQWTPGTYTSGVTTTLVDELSGKCLDVQQADYANGTPIDEYDCNGTGAQEWIINTTNGTILNAVSGMCLDTGWGTTDGTQLQLWDCQSNLQGDQQWRWQSDGSILNTYSNLCLNIWGGSTADDTPIKLYDCQDTANEKWFSPEVPPPPPSSGSSDCGDPTWGCYGPPPPGSCGPWEGYPSCPSVGCPLALNFTSGPITFLGHGVPFDFFGNGTEPLADWIGPQFGVLALPDGRGDITTGGQLFGTATKLPDGSYAADGFSALAQYDANGDGTIDDRDAVFSRLALWFDANSNGSSDPGEVVSLASRGVTALVLSDETVDIDTDATGSYVGLNSTFAWTPSDGSAGPGELADVYFALQPSPSRFSRHGQP